MPGFNCHLWTKREEKCVSIITDVLVNKNVHSCFRRIRNHSKIEVFPFQI